MPWGGWYPPPPARWLNFYHVTGSFFLRGDTLPPNVSSALRAGFHFPRFEVEDLARLWHDILDRDVVWRG